MNCFQLSKMCPYQSRTPKLVVVVDPNPIAEIGHFRIRAPLPEVTGRKSCPRYRIHIYNVRSLTQQACWVRLSASWVWIQSQCTIRMR